MPEQELRPIDLPISLEEKFERKILKFLEDILVKPLRKEIKKKKSQIFNSKQDLINAIRSGRLQFEGDVFFGTFNATLSRELLKIGASFDSRVKGYRIAESLVPLDIRSAAAQSVINFRRFNQDVLKIIDEMDFEAALEAIQFDAIYDDILKGVDSQFVKSVSKSITVSPEITQAQRKLITENFSENLKLSIKKFSDQQVLSLRRQVEKNFLEGARADKLERLIQEQFDVNKSKAEFLAVQETNLLTSEYSEIRYKDIGSTQYRWSTSKDARVRDDHEKLDGQIFSWDSPPVVDVKTGRRAHPGRDWRCRCKAIPIIIT